MKSMFKGVTLRGLVAVFLLTVGGLAVIGGIAIVILGVIEGNLEIGLGGILSIVIGVLSGKAGSWIYDEEDMDEEI